MTAYVQREEACSRCRSVVPTVEHTPGPPYDEQRPRGAKEYLCMFCYETHIGTILRYRHPRDGHDIAKALSQALHIVLREVKKP